MYSNKNIQRDLKTKGLKEMYSNNNIQRDLKKAMYTIYSVTSEKAEALI